MKQTTRITPLIAATIISGLLASACAQSALKDVFRNDLLVGAALNPGHFSGATNAEDETIEAFARLGLKVMITELDVNVLPTPGPGGADVSFRFAADPKLNPYPDGLPKEMEQRLARRYASAKPPIQMLECGQGQSQR